MKKIAQLSKFLDRSRMESSDTLIQRIAYDANGNPEYLGMALPGSAANSANWFIRKIAYDVNQNPVSILFAEGSLNFDKVWDDRATYSFS